MLSSGIRIVESAALVVLEQHTVRRSWCERLFSWPWRPRVAENTVTVEAPDSWMYWAGLTVYCHPAVVVEVREEVKRNAF